MQCTHTWGGGAAPAHGGAAPAHGGQHQHMGGQHQHMGGQHQHMGGQHQHMGGQHQHMGGSTSTWGAAPAHGGQHQLILHSVLLQVKMLITDAIVNGACGLLWSAAFVFTSDQWRKTDISDPLPAAVNNCANAGVAFSFLCTLLWVRYILCIAPDVHTCTLHLSKHVVCTHVHYTSLSM